MKQIEYQYKGFDAPPKEVSEEDRGKIEAYIKRGRRGRHSKYMGKLKPSLSAIMILEAEVREIERLKRPENPLSSSQSDDGYKERINNPTC